MQATAVKYTARHAFRRSSFGGKVVLLNNHWDIYEWSEDKDTLICRVQYYPGVDIVQQLCLRGIPREYAITLSYRIIGG